MSPKPSATRLARVFSDHPIGGEGGELQFQFEGFARTLAELAWNPANETPFTVVVRGGWGRGKTTLLKRAQWMLENPDELGDRRPPEGVRTVRTLWFNAWKYPSDDTVLAGLLGALIDRLAKGNKVEQLAKFVASYKGSAVRSLFGLVVPAPIREKVLGKDWEDHHGIVHEKRAFHDTFRDLFNQTSRLLFDVKIAARDTAGLPESKLWTPAKQKEEVLVVFLDDLDRCRRERVVEVIEAINLFLDLPGVCFFLGTDWERLVKVLPEAVQDDADQFLEKVVQVAFDLPAVSGDDAQAYVKHLLDGTDLQAVLVGEGEQANADLRILARVLETLHPRHVKRFLNDLSITLAVLRNTDKLGDREDKLPEAAIVAWHLLSEILPREEWSELRALPQNLDKFLVDVKRLEAATPNDEEDGEREDDPAWWGRLKVSGVPERHLRTLRELSDDQRHLLVHFATPPTIEGRRGRTSIGRRKLFDLSSDAWVEIPGGTFWMGAQQEDEAKPGYDLEAEPDESPVRRVTVSGFRLSRYPVTNADYAAYVAETGKAPPEHWDGGEIPEGKREHPVVQVSWTDAVAFCEWLSRRLAQGEDDWKARLPTEAEWEYAARGATGRRYPWVSEVPTEELVNFGHNVDDTTPVGSYPEGATPEGVHDMAGNVWEWCRDWYGSYPDEDETDPTGPSDGSGRVLRGGRFFNYSGGLRAAYRYGLRPGFRNFNLGFRVSFVSSRGL